MSESSAPPRTIIRGAAVFDGRTLREGLAVVIENGTIDHVGAAFEPPADADVVDATGRTLLPGLIDAHAHIRPPLAEMALDFGVTTVLDMGSQPSLMLPYRHEAEHRNDIADLRSSSWPATPEGGHPSSLVGLVFDEPLPGLDDAAAAATFVDARLGEQADYIKLVIEDGTMIGGRPLPTLSRATSDAVVRAAHERGRLAVAHAHTVQAARQAVASGVDGLMHLFLDAPDDALIGAIADGNVFVTPTLTLLEAMVGRPTGCGLAEDPRVQARLDDEWLTNLRKTWRFETPGRYENAADAVDRLRRAGVPLLAGTDAACLGCRGTGPGVSLHRELELLVEAGLRATEALAAATSLPAERFGLADRGRIAPGLQADIVLVDGDPTRDIAHTLDIVGVWRRGERLERRFGPPGVAEVLSVGKTVRE